MSIVRCAATASVHVPRMPCRSTAAVRCAGCPGCWPWCSSSWPYGWVPPWNCRRSTKNGATTKVENLQTFEMEGFADDQVLRFVEGFFGQDAGRAGRIRRQDLRTPPWRRGALRPGCHRYAGRYRLRSFAPTLRKYAMPGEQVPVLDVVKLGVEGPPRPDGHDLFRHGAPEDRGSLRLHVGIRLSGGCDGLRRSGRRYYRKDVRGGDRRQGADHPGQGGREGDPDAYGA